MVSEYISDFEKRTCRLKCGIEIGTAFLLTPKIAITATHCIIPHTEDSNKNVITLEFLKLSENIITRTALPLHSLDSHTYPVIILKLNEKIEGVPEIDFSDYETEYNMTVEAFGYPTVNDDGGILFRGDVISIIRENEYHSADWNIGITPKNNIASYKGLSGSPLFKAKNLIGVMSHQTKEDRSAVIVSAIGTRLFKEYLAQNGFKCASAEKSATDASAVMGENVLITIGTLSNTNSILTTQINDLETKYVTEKMNEIIDKAINIDEFAAWNTLQKIVDDPSTQIEHYANIYALAAKMQIFKDIDLSLKYYEILLKIKPSYDTRALLSAMHMKKQEWDKAIEILHPIDNISVYNQLLQIYQLQNTVVDFEALCPANVEKDTTSHNLLALCYLQNKNYDRALEHINYLNEKHPSSPLYWCLNGVVNYWKFLPYKLYNNQPGAYLPIFTGSEMILSIEQYNGISIALEHFKKSKSFAKANKSKEFDIHSTIGCLLTSWLLKDATVSKFCDELLKLDETNAVAIFYLHSTQEEISEDCLNKFKTLVCSNKGTGAEAVVCIEHLIEKGELNEASKLLSLCKNKIQEYSYNDLIYLNLFLSINQKKYKQAKKIIQDSKLSLVEKKRATLLICQYDSSDEKRQLSIATKAISLQGDSIDYLNLCRCYRKYNKWDKIPRIAQEWFEKHGDIIALEYRAIALYNCGNDAKCLKTIKEIEKIATLDKNIKKLKIWCFVRKGNFDEASSLIADVGFPLEDKQLVIIQAEMHISKGEDLDAISLYRAYIRNNPKDKDIATRIIGLLRGCNMKDEAYKQQKQLSEVYPNDLSILVACMNLGFELGLQDEAMQLMVDIQQKDKTNKYIKPFALEEMQKFLKKNREGYEQFDVNYFNGEIPLHWICDHKKHNIGYSRYQSFVEKLSVNFSCFGGRLELSSFDCFSDGKIVMDYTACLTAYSLGLFSVLTKYFKTIYIDRTLLPIIMNDMADLSKYQPDVYEKHERLLSYINSIDKIKIVDMPNIPEDHLELNKADLNSYYCAIENNAFVVKDKFSTELFDKKAIPECLQSIHIKEDAILLFLSNNGVYIPDAQKYINEDLSKIQTSTTLLVDYNLLEQLQEYNALDDFVEIFNIILMQFDYDIIKYDCDCKAQQDKCIKWLESLKLELSSLYEKNIIKFIPQNVRINKNDSEIIKYSDLLINAMDYTAKSKIPVWVDDRCVNSYQMVGNGVIVGILDILAMLYDKGILSKETYFQNISYLIKHKVNYFVPSNEYIIACLTRAGIRDNRIVETSRLKELRNYIQFAINADSKIGQQQLKHVSFSEALLFLRNLDVAFHKIIVDVWNNTEKDVYWKQAVGEWLLFYFSDFVCDVSFCKNENIVNSIASKHSLLLMNAITIKEIAYAVDYSQWILVFINLYWSINPSDLSLVANNIAHWVFSLEKDIYQKLVLKKMMLLFYGPHSLFYEILNNPVFEGKWSDCAEFTKITKHEQEQKEISYNEIISGDLIEYLYSNPDKWKTVIYNVIKEERTAEEAINVLVDFFNKYIRKHTSIKLHPDCRAEIALMAWYCTPEQRIDIQELKRKFL